MRAWVGIGSNLAGDTDGPRAQLQRAVDALALLPATRVVAVSPVYRNPPLLLPGQAAPDQPEYCNAVAGLDTALAPLALLDALQAMEHAQGRVRAERWGARTIDLDLLLFGNDTIRNERLTVPHPGIAERRFVLQPLFDIAPDLVLPDGRTVRELLARCPPSPLVRDGELRTSR